MNKNLSVSGSREALIAELLGDLYKLTERVEALVTKVAEVDSSGRETAYALSEATNEYRSQVDASVIRLRAELATIILKSTETAAQTLVTQQTKVLQASAQQAFRDVLGKESHARMRSDRLRLAAISGVCGGLIAALLVAVLRY